MRTMIDGDAKARLEAAGLAGDAIAAWLADAPSASGDFLRDRATFAERWRKGGALFAALPRRPARNAAERAAAETILASDRSAREGFLAAHAARLYRELTGDLSRFIRVEDLPYKAASLVPGIAPTREAVAAESALPLKDKEAIEADQGLLVSRILADPVCGRHLCHAMLLPRAEAGEGLAEFRAHGRVDLGAASVTRIGKGAVVELRHPRFLNAEDDTTIDAAETAADIALLDPESEVVVLRGGPVEHPKYGGRRVFCAGINLTHLYHGKIPYLWYLERDMGIVNKIYRGLATPDALPDDVSGGTIEKPWIVAIEEFAIGGGCQYLLVMDYVLAGRGAYMTLPARKEGIIPGAANLRMARFTGDRLARQAILYERRLECDSPEGRLICDEIVPQGEMDAAITRTIAGFTDSGVVSAAGNRAAIRVGQEPLDLFRSYMAVYAREQAACHFSPALVVNLERFWNARNRRA